MTDDPSKYRISAEVELWKLRDPIARLRALLHRNYGVGADYFADCEAQAADLGADLRSRCLALPDPAPVDMFDHVYADPHPVMDAERAQLADYLASFEGAS